MRVIVVLAIVSGSAVASAECRMEADLRWSTIEAEVLGREPIEVALREDLQVELLPSDSDGIRFRTRGSVELVGRIPRDRPLLVTVQRESVWAGPVQLHRGATLDVKAVTEAGLFGVVHIAERVVARVGPIPCRGLRLIRDLEEARLYEWDAPSHVHVDARVDGPRIRLRRAGVAAWIHTAEPLEVVRVERRGHLVHVRRDYPSGISIDGWVRAGDVTTIERRTMRLLPDFHELTLRGGGASSCGVTHTIHVRQGVDAVVRDGPQGAPWATVREATRLEAIRMHGGYSLCELPGMRLGWRESERAWVSATEVEELPSPQRR